MMTTTPLRQIDANAITNNAPKGRGDEVRAVSPIVATPHPTRPRGRRFGRQIKGQGQGQGQSARVRERAVRAQPSA